MKEQNMRLCEELWLEYEPKLRKICMAKFKGNADTADDIVARVYLALCERLDRDDMPGAPVAWLYGVMNNIINTEYRELYNRQSRIIAFDDIEYNLPFTDGGVEDKIDEVYNGEIKAKLRRILSEDEYAIIEYIYFDRLKMKEIACKIGSTQSAVKQKHYRICNKLRKAARDKKW